MSYIKTANLRCSEIDTMSASEYVLIVFVCTGTPIANLIDLLSMFCNFFRSVIGEEKIYFFTVNQL